ncbi:hypothetical protein AB0C96_35650 [Streptomyces sp. NPDC048506]
MAPTAIDLLEGFAKVNARFDALETKMDGRQAQIVELLSALVGKNPDES